MIDLKDKVPENEWLPIKDEKFREYIFPDCSITIVNPVKVMIRFKPEGHSHRIIGQDPETKEFTSYYVPAGWRCIRWKGVDGTEAFGW
jgi:hypothetical protein